MIFPLKPVTSNIGKINEVPLFFLRKSQSTTRFDVSLFPKWFEPVYTRCPGVEDVFKSVFRAFRRLTNGKQNYLINEYQKSFDVKKVCNDNSIFIPCADDFDPIIKKPLIELFRFLYENTINTEVFKKVTGMHADDHYDEFFRSNEIHVCPFCGLESYTFPEYRRAEYDHYLPISLYPIFGVNFNNLVPMGDHCNGKKNDSDILYGSGRRRVIIYPYGSFKYNLAVKCINKPSLTNVEGLWEVKITASSPKRKAQIKAWDEVFSVQTQFSSSFKRFHKRFIEDFAHKNKLEGKTLTITQLRNELKKYRRNGIGDPKMETMAVLRSAWSSFHSTVGDVSQLTVIKNMVANTKRRVKP